MEPSLRDLLPKKAITTKRAEFDDCKGLTAMIDAAGGGAMFKAQFGQYNFNTMIETSYLSIVVTEAVSKESSSDENYVGFLSVDDRSSISGDYDCFTTSINALSQFIPVHLNNTLFINFWYVDDRANAKLGAGQSLITQVFTLCPQVDFVVWLAPASFIPNEYVEKTFTLLNNVNNIKELKGTKPYFLHRSNFLPKLQVREARVEDNDDLIPILRKFNPEILVGQENFFLADLIQKQDDNNRFFVGLKRNDIVGMLATSLDVNVSLIMRIFDISAFSNIIIQEEEKPLPPPLIVSIVGDLRLLDLPLLQEIVENSNCIYINGEDLKNDVYEAGREESKNDTSDTLNAYLDNLLTQRGRNQPPPHAFVICGYPRSEAEAFDQLHNIVNDFNVIIELFNSAEDVEEDEEDAFLQQHLDGLEILREQYFSPDKRHIMKNARAQWRKVTIDSEVHTKTDNLNQVSNELSRILDQRMVQVELQRAKDNEEPPKANAFALTVFCLEDDYTSRGEDLLRVAFEDHPHHSYCLLMVPNGRPPSALTQSMTFVKTRPGISFDQSLFIMHRSYFLAHDNLTVSRLLEPSLPDVEQFISPLYEDDKQLILQNAGAALKEFEVELRDNPEEVSFTVEIGKCVIGVIQLSRKILTNDDLNWYRANYCLDDHINFDRHRLRSVAVITQWVLDPIYSNWSRHIIREIMRKYNKTLLLFHNTFDAIPPKEILDEFLFLNPRRRIQQSPNGPPIDAMTKPTANTPGADSSLYCISKYFLAKPKEIIAKRVVVIGGSPHSYAFLETLFSVPYLSFPNVYLVLQRLPPPFRGAGSDPSDTVSSFSGEESKLDDDYSGCLSVKDVDYPTDAEVYALGLSHKVSLVRGRLTDIDRENKAVIVSDDAALEYDVLLLSSNTQDNSSKRFPSLYGMHPSKCADCGVIELGNSTADFLAMKWIRKRYTPKVELIIVYGSTIKALTAVLRLTRAGIAPSRLMAILPDTETLIDEIEEPSVAKKLVELMKNANVKIRWGHLISDVSLNRSGFIQYVDLKNRSDNIDAAENDVAAGLSFESVNEETGELRIQCMALLCCNQFQCDRDMFAAVNDSGLVFDGGLVVDAAFGTVDPLIYAVSDFTRFSRTYKDAIPHARFNPRELGSFVALKVLSHHLDPNSTTPYHAHPLLTHASMKHHSHHDSHHQHQSGSSVHHVSLMEHFGSKHSVNNSHSSSHHHAHRIQQPLPVFTLPRSYYTELPGGLYFFQSSIPKTPEEASLYPTPHPPTNNHGVIVPSVDTGHYCYLKCDLLGKVVDFVYLGRDPIEERNLRHVAGKHEAFLNCAIFAHKKQVVTDWIAFFRAGWANTLYHDKYNSLIRALRTTLKSDKGMVMILSRIFERAENTNNDTEVEEYRRTYIGPHCEILPEATLKSVQVETIEFLKANKATLSQYHIPTPKAPPANDAPAVNEPVVSSEVAP